MKTNNNTRVPLLQLSQHLLYAVKTGQPSDHLQAQLYSITLKELVQQLTGDREKKAFWINIYNGFTQAMLTADPDAYLNRREFFTSKQIRVAERLLSLDDIEHGILRRSKVKWGLGYVGNLFAGKTERMLRVNKVDYRIHFALNCGARSCPPIAFYKSEELDQQLNLATAGYLNNEVNYNSITNTVCVPALMSWFRGDFGGKQGMLSILRQHKVISPDAQPVITYKAYDWSVYPDHYTTG